jgi:TonB-dependent SusC/RagA subfamily outer membrane receptor
MDTTDAIKGRGKLDDTLAAMFSNAEYRASYLFYAHIIGQCSIKIDRDMPAPAGVSFSVDHYNLYINPDEFDQYTLKERLAILKHEALHILYGHVGDRGLGKNPVGWNISTDCALNQHIDQEHLPECAILPKPLQDKMGIIVPAGQSAEFYYELLKSELQNKQSNQGNQSNQPSDGQSQEQTQSSQTTQSGQSNVFEALDTGKSMDTHKTWDESVGDKDLQKDLSKRMIERAQTEALKGKGTIPAACADWIELHSRRSEVNWKRVLRGIVGHKRVGTRSTIMRLDRRFPNREDLRGKTRDRMFNLLVVVDVSGSMSPNAIKGHVKDASGEPIMGATITVNGKAVGITDMDGNFSVDAAPGANLTFTYLGMTPKTIKATSNMMITLVDDQKSLNEVVVIGYGRAKKNDLTGSVTAIKPDEMSKGITSSASDMLVGKIAGVDVQTGGGQPGSGAQIRIRGGASLNASNDPLYVIDGLAIDNNNLKGTSNVLAMINPNDIESFTVLKDASATAIYGSRASNGVIIITTKKGRAGQRPTVTYNGDVDDTIRSTRTIDGCCRSVLQYSEAFDIVRVNHRQDVTCTLQIVIINSQTIDYVERVIRSIQRGTTTDTNLCSRTRLTATSLYVNTGNLTYQHIRGTACDTL